MMRASVCAAFALALAGTAHAVEIVDPSASYPEGAYWRDGRAYYTEMGADQVSTADAKGKQVYWRARGCGPTSIATYGPGLLVLCHPGGALVALDADGRSIRQWNRTDGGQPLQDPNDSSPDGRGGVYVSDPGVFSMSAPVTGAILHLTADGALKRVADGLRYPNGVFVDQRQNALYVDEHLKRRILKFPILPDGSLGDFTVFADLNRLTHRVGDYAEAGPDGLERGPDGDLYVCLYGEGRILRLSPQGRIVASIPVPTPYVTNIAFAPDGSAYVTGSFENLAPPFPGQVMRLSPAQLRGAPDR